MVKHDDYLEIPPQSHTGINININLNKLPKCPHCKKGEMLPLQYTDYTSTHVFNYGWMCNSCYRGWMWVKGVLTPTQLSNAQIKDENSEDDNPL